MRIRVVDAFTDRPFAGSPAGVCLLPDGPWPDQTWMRQVAAEMNHPATAFARPAGEDWDLRWFTTVVELDLCGHGTLATAHVLRGDGAIDGSVRFHTRRAGALTAEVAPDGTVTLAFPVARPSAATAPPDLAAVLGVETDEVYRTGALRDLLVVLPDETAVRAVVPDLTAMADLTSREDIRGIIVTAPADGEAHDFVSRFFAPALGIPEDPVTGSAHTALAPYWSGRFGRDELVGYQASARGGFVRTTLAGDTVRLSGKAVTVLDAVLTSA